MQTGMWTYDPTAEQWTQHRDLIAYDDSNDDLDYDFSAVPRQYAASFVIGNQGYVATGYNAGSLTSCWFYEPTTDVWTKKTDFGGAARTQAIGFGLGDKGYVSLGVTGSTRLDDTWTIAPNDLNE
jgi:N-acetylneuraminic acid mutarotase